MSIAPAVRRFVLTAHITASVGWLGAVVVFLALAVVGLVSDDASTVRAVYLVMAPAGWSVLVPLSVASLLTGLVQSLGTRWGLFRHYWVLFKLVLNIGAVVVLLAYMQTLSRLADVAAGPTFPAGDLGEMRMSPMIHSVLTVPLLLGAVVLSVYKPRAMTRYGRRKQRDQRAGAAKAPTQHPIRSARLAMEVGHRGTGDTGQ